MNLTSDVAILPYAPDRKAPNDDKFHSDGMRTLDEVLSHMDDQHYDAKFLTPLEKVVHAFHMKEVWEAAREEYSKLKAHPPGNTTCECVMDIENNGILKMLRKTALEIREPQLVYGDKLKKVSKRQIYPFGLGPPYRFRGMKSEAKTANEIQESADHSNSHKISKRQIYPLGLGPPYRFRGMKSEARMTKEMNMDSILSTEDQAMPHLLNQQSWVKWKEIIDMPKDHYFDTALFLYCALN
uniref:Uncharacterized protein n=1 Tax=Acrobeloides nanus TaxID=290746 RepID=A0A914EN43_9BILA